MRTSRVAHHRFRFVYLNKEAFFFITQQFDAYYTVDNTIFKNQVTHSLSHHEHFFQLIIIYN